MGGIFGTLSKRVSDQQREISDLRCELDAANKESNTLREVTKSHILDIMQKSKEDAKEERARFTAQIKYLLADLEESNEQSATEAVETVFREFDLLTAQDRSAHDFRVRKIDALEESTLSIMDESVRRQERAEKVTKKVFEVRQFGYV